MSLDLVAGLVDEMFNMKDISEGIDDRSSKKNGCKTHGSENSSRISRGHERGSRPKDNLRSRTRAPIKDKGSKPMVKTKSAQNRRCFCKGKRNEDDAPQGKSSKKS